MTQYTLIIGLGKTGLSAARYCLREQKPFIVLDERTKPPQLAALKQIKSDVSVVLGGFSVSLLNQADELIVSPGISPGHPFIQAAYQKNIPVCSDMSIFSKAAKAPILAITGSNGKSTLVTLLGDMIRASNKTARVLGNIGEPVLDALSDVVPDYYVLEMSSFQLEYTDRLYTHTASIINLSDDHLDRHHTMDAYRNAKKRIYYDCKVAVVSRLDVSLWPESAPSIISFGLDAPSGGNVGIIDEHIAYDHQRLMPLAELRLPGQHNQLNALAALAFGLSIRLDMSAMLKTLSSFMGLKHRCQWIAETEGVSWYNDSKATNVGAAMAAIESLGKTCSGSLVLIAGGLGKNADFSPLKSLLKQYVREVVLIGQAADEMALCFKGGVAVTKADSLALAIKAARQSAQEGDIVLLSPACASFDMFEGFEARGDAFVQLVKEGC